MFHEGTLQSGIALAIQEQKLVACFVRDSSDESATWENDWLQSGWLSSLLAQKAIVLRLSAGSTEAGFLGAFCSLDKVPTLVIIHNGELREQLVSGVGKTEFVNRVRKVLGAEAIPGVEGSQQAVEEDQGKKEAGKGSARSAALERARAAIEKKKAEKAARAAQGDGLGSAETISASSPSASAPSASAPSVSTPSVTPSDSVPSASTPPASTPSATTSSASTPSSKDKGKQKAVPDNGKAVQPRPEPKSNASSSNTAQQAARDAIRKKKQEEKEDLARIQARIEADKAERKAQALAAKAERERLAQASPEAPQSQAPTSSNNRGSLAKQVNLNVRLFDGQTIRNTFPRAATLQDDVRPWIDSECAKRAEPDTPQHPPYIFKQILAPLPSREMSAGDESQTLGDMDLAPSATLVLIPIKGFTEAYSSGASGVVGGAVSSVTGLVGGIYTAAYDVATLISGSMFGSRATDPNATSPPPAAQSASAGAGRSLGGVPDPSAQDAPTAAAAGSSVRVRTLADQRAREPRREFYNGNTLDFEPNDDSAPR